MKRVLTLVFLGALLSGCGLLPRPPETPRLQACVTARILSDRRTVVLDGLCSRGTDLEYHWDLGDGTTIENGPPVVQHVYQPGVYVATLLVRGQDPAGGGNGGIPGDPPGAPGLGGPETESWAYAIIDLAEPNKPRPIILTMYRWSGEPRTVFYSAYIVMTAEASYSPAGLPLVYWWEVVRVDPDTLEPIPYPGEQEPRFEYSSAKTWELFFRGPPCDGFPHRPFRYRITLRVRDSNWQEAIAHHYIWVH